jgi:hypothetical protein
VHPYVGTQNEWNTALQETWVIMHDAFADSILPALSRLCSLTLALPLPDSQFGDANRLFQHLTALRGLTHLAWDVRREHNNYFVVDRREVSLLNSWPPGSAAAAGSPAKPRGQGVARTA